MYKQYLHLCGVIIKLYCEIVIDLSAFLTDFTKEQVRKCTLCVTILALHSVGYNYLEKCKTFKTIYWT